MNTRLIQYFCAAAECGSFTLAAQRLYTAQPNFSKQIAALEREIGARLFYREHRSVRLTPAGQAFYAEVRDIPGQLLRGIEAAQQQERREANQLQIGILEGHQLSAGLMEKLDRFRRRHPDSRQIISRGDFRTLQTGLEERRFDVVFTILFTMPEQAGIQTRVLYAQQTFAAVPVSHPLAQREALSFSDLDGAAFVMLDEASSPLSYQDLRRQLDRISAEVHLVSSTEALFTSVEANLGIAIVDGQNRLRNSPFVRLIPLQGTVRHPDFGAAWINEPPKALLAEFLAELEH